MVNWVYFYLKNSESSGKSKYSFKIRQLISIVSLCSQCVGLALLFLIYVHLISDQMYNC